jgi:soluble lytic murein transglycosylase
MSATRRGSAQASSPIALVGALCAALVVASWTAPVAAEGGLYRHVDARGVVHFTDAKQPGYQTIRAPRGFSTSAIRPGQSRRYDRLIARAAGMHQIPPALVKAVIAAESSFDEQAVSRAGAMGLMQLMPQTAALLGVAEPFRAEPNVFGGTAYLRTLHDRYQSWTTTLAAYNAGPSAVDHYRGVPPFAETREYVRRVLSYYRRFHGDFPR